MTKKNRDNKVALLYDLENHQLPKGGSFSTHADIQVWVDEITSSRFWTQRSYLPQAVRVLSNGDLDWSECKGTNEIWICNSHLRAAIVLHELAHFFPSETHHGPKFIRAYLGLLAQFLGIAYSTVYREAFLIHKIKF